MDEYLYAVDVLESVANRQAERIAMDSGFVLGTALEKLEKENFKGFPIDHEKIVKSKIMFILQARSGAIVPAAA
jgi:hypothetical protein